MQRKLDGAWLSGGPTQTQSSCSAPSTRTAGLQYLLTDSMTDRFQEQSGKVGWRMRLGHKPPHGFLPGNTKAMDYCLPSTCDNVCHRHNQRWGQPRTHSLRRPAAQFSCILEVPGDSLSSLKALWSVPASLLLATVAAALLDALAAPAPATDFLATSAAREARIQHCPLTRVIIRIPF